MATRPVSFAILTSCSASSALSVIGISTSTCLPARITCSPCRKCSFVGVVRITASARLLPGGGLALARGLAAVLKNDVAHRGVRRRHSVEAVDLFHPLVECPAHDQPHDHFDPFGAGLAHVVDVRDARELLGILGEIIEE